MMAAGVDGIMTAVAEPFTCINGRGGQYYRYTFIRSGCGGTKSHKSVHTNKQMTHEGNAFRAKSVSFVRHLFVRVYTFVFVLPTQ
jgi:hypothetical protein